MLVYLSIEGQERIALGQEPFAWQYLVQEKEISYEHNYVLVSSFTPNLPTREACMDPVLKGLKEKEDKINAEAFMELQRLKGRRESLLCLTLEPSPLDEITGGQAE